MLETAVTETGTLALRGPMVPRHPFPPGAERAPMPLLHAGRRAVSPTPRYPCRADRDSGELAITGPPPGIVSVGGYRFMPDQLQDLVGRDRRRTPSWPRCPTRWPATGWPAAPPIAPRCGKRSTGSASIRWSAARSRERRRIAATLTTVVDAPLTATA